MNKPIYLDHHATTPCDPEVVAAMLPFFTEKFGNPSSRSHVFGIEADAAVEHARRDLAEMLGADAREIVFTSGATEACNLAVLGAARARRGQGRHLIVSAVEHKAVLDAAAQLVREGHTLDVLPVDGEGRVDPDALARRLRPDTTLVSVMAANNEVGVVQPIAEIGALCRAHGAWLHVDATQTPGHLPIDVGAWQADLLSLSAHKMYGPKGVGALYVRKGRPKIALEPLQFGGGQERGLRSGTLPVPLLVGLGRAARLATAALAAGEGARVAGLRDRLWGHLEALGAVRNGHPVERLPHNLHVSFPGVEAAAVLMAAREIAFSSGSACASGGTGQSHVLVAMGLGGARAFSSLRFGLGRGTTADEVDRAAAVLGRVLPGLRAAGAGLLG